MKRTLLVIGILVFAVTAATVYRVCVSDKGESVEDVTSLLGVYEGEATISLPDHLKKMAANIQANGQKLLPDGPVPCRVKVKLNEKQEVCMELVDFKMPVEGITLEPSVCTVTQAESVYNLEGKGSVSYNQQKLNYSHKGKIQDKELDVNLTLVVVPMVAEPKVIFKGRKV